MRSQSSVYGKKNTITPNLERLAARGVVFDRAYSQITVCNPSRTSFMTGRAPDVGQVWNFERTAYGEVVALPTYFRAHGYTVLGAGKLWHWGPGPCHSWSDDVATFWPTSDQFQALMTRDRKIMESTVSPMRYDPPGTKVKDDDGPGAFTLRGFVDEQIANRSCELLDLLVAGGKEPGAVMDGFASRDVEAYIAAQQSEQERPPFFLGVGFHLPHEPYLIPGAAWEQYDDVDIKPLDGNIKVRPFGMPAFAFGDLIGNDFEIDELSGPAFKYFDPVLQDGKIHRKFEVKGKSYGPSARYDPHDSPVANAQNDHPFPRRMQYELQRGYNAAVTYMDSQLGKVLDKLDQVGQKKRTVVIFFSDHGYALGERAQWGKRSLFEV